MKVWILWHTSNDEDIFTPTLFIKTSYNTSLWDALYMNMTYMHTFYCWNTLKLYSTSKVARHIFWFFQWTCCRFEPDVQSNSALISNVTLSGQLLFHMISTAMQGVSLPYCTLEADAKLEFHALTMRIPPKVLTLIFAFQNVNMDKTPVLQSNNGTDYSKWKSKKLQI